MSRMFTGKMRLEPQHVPLVPLLQAAVDTVRPSAKAKHINLEFNDRAGGASVFADPTRLQQVVWNLLTNAVKFTPPGGRIRVTTSRTGDNLRIEVADTGIGIDPAFVPHVFDRFRQADSGTTRTYGGPRPRVGDCAGSRSPPRRKRRGEQRGNGQGREVRRRAAGG